MFRMETTQPRIMRGYAILAKGEQPKALAENTYIVKSQSGNGSYRAHKCSLIIFRLVFVFGAFFWVFSM
jgi:hypothetical protein